MVNQYKSSAFTIYKGNNLDPKFTYKLNGTAQDISTAKLYFTLSDDEYGTTVLFTLKNTAAGGDDTQISWVTDGKDGAFYVHLLPTHTENLLENKKYLWEIKMIIDVKVTTLGQNLLNILETIS